MYRFAQLALVLTFLSGFSSFAATGDVIAVVGKGEKKVAPDIATITLEVWSRSKAAKAAQETNNKIFAKVEKALIQDFKIDPKEIQTSNFSVNPEYKYNSGEQTFTGYSVSHQLTVTYRDVSKVGPFIDKIVTLIPEDKKGGLRFQGVAFGVEKIQDIELEVLQLALNNARTKANALAKAAGREVKGVKSITQSYTDHTPVRPMMRGAEMAKAMSDESTSIHTGEITVTATVSGEFNF